MCLPDGAGLEKEWMAVKVMDKVGSRSYQVGTGDIVWHRNHFHLLPQHQWQAPVDRRIGSANQELEEIPSKHQKADTKTTRRGTGMSRPQQAQILKNQQCKEQHKM